jgi:hypothetical protein
MREGQEGKGQGKGSVGNREQECSGHCGRKGTGDEKGEKGKEETYRRGGRRGRGKGE